LPGKRHEEKKLRKREKKGCADDLGDYLPTEGGNTEKCQRSGKGFKDGQKTGTKTNTLFLRGVKKPIIVNGSKIMVRGVGRGSFQQFARPL